MTTPAPPLPTGNATLCISVAARPGRFGITVHNAGYRAAGLDYFYRAHAAADIAPVIAAVRTLGIRGCSVSMPFKEAVIPLLDRVDAEAGVIGAVNSVVNDDGCLTGYNTDVTGVARCLEEIGAVPGWHVTVLGAGGVARAVLEAVHRTRPASVTVYARRAGAPALAAASGATARPWMDRAHAAGDLVINATSLGMDAAGDLPLTGEALRRHRLAFDVVASPAVTPWLVAAARVGLTTIDGFRMAFHQACHQFRLYTGTPAPAEAMWAAARGLRQG